jgi:GT2 family glycosyltransferase
MSQKANKIHSVAAVVLNYRRAEDTITCVKSLSQSEGVEQSIIVVDNGSDDDSADRIEAAFPGIRLILNRSNIGYAAGNNVGIRAALEGGADYVFIVNNDCVVAPDALRIMVESALSREAGIVSPKVYDFYDREIIQYAGYRNLHLLAQGIPIGEGEMDTGQYEVEREMNAAPGCAMLLSRRLCEEAGLFDENFFAYSEELDLCRRARERGFRILFVPAAHVWHKKAATLDALSPEYTYYLTRGRLLYARKHLNRWALLFIFMPYFVVVKLVKPLLLFIFQGRWKNVTALMRATTWNLSSRLRFRV